MAMDRRPGESRLIATLMVITALMEASLMWQIVEAGRAITS